MNLTRNREIVSVEFDEYALTPMTHPQLETSGPGFQRMLAACFAAIVLVAQCSAVAHYHPLQRTSIHTAQAAALDDGLCALCLFHQQSSGLSPTVPLLSSPANIGAIDLYSAQSWPLYSFNSYLLGRSPPALA